MKDKNIKIIIGAITQQYGYLLEDIRSKSNNSELWTVSKDIDGVQQRLIFASESSIDELTQYDIPSDKNNLYVLISEDEMSKDVDNYSSNNLLGKPIIKVAIKERKISYSENANLQVVQDLASLMSHSNLYVNSGKVDLKQTPLITMIIIAINIIMYGITAYMTFVYAGGSVFDSDTNVLIVLGAKVNELIAQGEYFRLITCMFLHGGLVHLGVNMYSLYAMGPTVEKIYGKAKYVVIYFVAGICSSMLSYILSPSISIGASGAIFGLLGAMLVFAIKSKGKTGSGFIKSILSVIFMNIFIGMTLPGIDNFGHIGGLLGGMFITFFITLKSKI